MRKRIFCSLLIFMFAWVAVGALDCGCAYASPVEVSAHKKAPVAPEGMNCHGPEESKTKQSEETCCAGCQLESKAPTPPNVELSNPTQSKFSALLNTSKSAAFRFLSLAPAMKRGAEITSLSANRAQSVSVYNTPIYLAVQSFLI